MVTHELEPDLPLDFSIEDLCQGLDIEATEDKPVSSFAAAMLLMHPDKAWGQLSSPKAPRNGATS